MVLNGKLATQKRALHDLGLFVHGFHQFASKYEPNKITFGLTSLHGLNQYTTTHAYRQGFSPHEPKDHVWSH
jgi:hypothetical protein